MTLPNDSGPEEMQRPRASRAFRHALAATAVAAVAGVGTLSYGAHRAAAASPARLTTASVTTAVPAPAAFDTTCSKVNGGDGAQPQKPGADPLAVNQSEYDGWKMFHVYCYRCHGTDALGSDIAPNLRHSVGPEGTVDHACFMYTVTNGRLAKGMPTWKALLDTTQMENIYHYLRARSSGRLEPGRPHVAKTS